MYQIDLRGKNALVFGVANEHSIAWSIARLLKEAGANLILAYQNERFGRRVSNLVSSMDNVSLVECDVSKDESIQGTFETIKDSFGKLDIVVHSVAYAGREDLQGNFSETDRENFAMSLDISAYSLISILRYAGPMMEDGGSVIAMTFHASEKVYPGYNVMGTAKAALENIVRQLSSEFGKDDIRVNAISAGPLETLAARGISGFPDMKHVHAERAPLKRNITHDEVGKVGLFLCSDLSSGVTGSVIYVDAGFNIMAI
ncbi:MAG: enoyl-ACP reductase [Dehalococcoidia bacterium]|nr:enoyl-[acyl-carrier-protein] reductase FabI [Chloroflexota bacterium]MCH2524799.1 enoyl-ACP reductase [Dehalococcoidia bacterium]MQF99677.1 enoyl-ACP reductase [SAR202 cluster bacterium]|tara:strand:+ start:731 stop:1504 length:774 start_codon:yes stop_codon:yes gene_type:complete